jgi:hypothetical protein
MSDARIPRLAYGLLLGTGVLDWVRRYPLLPSRMASHLIGGALSMAVVGWFACALLFLQLFVASEAISANIASHRQFAIGATFAVLPGLVAFMGVCTVMLMRHFRRVPQ